MDDSTVHKKIIEEERVSYRSIRSERREECSSKSFKKQNISKSFQVALGRQVVNSIHYDSVIWLKQHELADTLMNTFH